MGKSDSFIIPEYIKLLNGLSYESIAFLGFSCENQLTKVLNGKVRHFYDLSLSNWEINSDWSLQQKYDLIVCTRCAYFSKDPYTFVDKCKNHLTERGHALIDWGLGDHWRFENYKVGWVRNGEHEFAYNPNNFLYSCLWKNEFSDHPETLKFWNCVKQNKNFNYQHTDTLEKIIKKEVPYITDYFCKNFIIKFLWPESPQLYIITLLSNERSSDNNTCNIG